MKSKTRIIGRYVVQKKIGQGAMGSVYLAYDEMIDRKVAIKSIRMEKKQSSKERSKTIDLFFEEAKIVGRLSHPHITSIYDMGINGYVPFLVMEYLSGMTVENVIYKKKNIPLEKILSLAAMICTAIHYVHRHGILHRDLKPSNIMIDMEHMTPKIMDFGIARPVRPAGDDLTEIVEETLWGTPYYMSPEQILGNEMSPRSDIFSLGVLFYEWISGQRPFTGNDTMEILHNIVGTRPAPLHDIAPIDRELAKIIHKAMKKEDEDRYLTAAAFADALEIYRERMVPRTSAEKDDPLDFSMGQRQIIEQLRHQYAFFYDFTDEEIFEIFQISTPETYDKGATIIQEGHSGKRMYFIIEGEALVRKEIHGKNVQLKQLSAGECFGEMAIIDNLPRVASVIALTRIHVIALNEAVLRHSNPVLCLKLFRSLAVTISEKLRLTDKKYLDLLDKLTKLTRESLSE